MGPSLCFYCIFARYPPIHLTATGGGGGSLTENYKILEALVIQNLISISGSEWQVWTTFWSNFRGHLAISNVSTQTCHTVPAFFVMCVPMCVFPPPFFCPSSYNFIHI